MNPLPYPWLQPVWQQFLSYWQANRLPHALIISAAHGMGKTVLAEHISRLALCQHPQITGQICGQCYTCQLADISQHPDYHILTPESPGQAIKIDAVRDLIERLQMASHYHAYRVIIINPAEAMNTAAANALLKTLEEPGARCLFLLITEANARLMATIRSRCQVLSITPNYSPAAQNWLQAQSPTLTATQAASLLTQAEGAPLLAQQLADVQSSQLTLWQNLLALSQGQLSPLALAQQEQQAALAFIDNLLSCLSYLSRVKIGHTNPAVDNEYAVIITSLMQLLQKLSFRQWMDYTYQVMQARTQLVQNVNLNGQLLLEALLIAWPLRNVVSNR
jgi:DNA polymerase-3 subunit delta'